MATVLEFQNMAHVLYKRARSMCDESEKLELMKMADDYLKRTEELRPAGVVQAAFPEHSDANASAVLRLLNHRITHR